MRWDSLFDDLESQLQGQLDAQFREEVAENIRVERATETLATRLSRLRGQQLRLHLCLGTEVHGVLGPMGDGYVCMDADTAQWIVCFEAIQRIALPRVACRDLRCAPAPSAVPLPTLLRGVMRDRSQVRLFAADGEPLAEGTLLQVGSDFLITAVHPRDEYARSSSVQEQSLIPLATLGWVLIPRQG